MSGLLYLAREFDALLHFGERFWAKSFRGVAKHFGVGLVTQDFHDSILVVVVLLAVAVIAEAQEPKKVPRIGYLSALDPARDSARAEAH